MQQLPDRSASSAPLRQKILIVSDHGLVRRGLRLMLSASTHHDLVDDDRAQEAVDQSLALHAPDLVIADVSTGGAHIASVRQALVNRQFHARFLVIARPIDLDHWSALGATAVSVADDAVVLLDAVRELASRTQAPPAPVPFAPPIPQAAVRPAPVHALAAAEACHVTPREREVIELITRGLCSKRIARELNISVTTVRTHRQRLMSKLGLRNSVEVAQFAARTFGTALASTAGVPA